MTLRVVTLTKKELTFCLNAIQEYNEGNEDEEDAETMLRGNRRGGEESQTGRRFA